MSLPRPRKNVVLLAYHYPPSNEVGGLRAAKVARALRDAGHQVTVITARLPGEASDLRLEEEGLQVRAVVARRNPREFYAEWKQRRNQPRQGTAAGAAADSNVTLGVPAKVPGWKRFIFSLLWLPDDKQGFIPSAIQAARPLIRPGSSVIYTSAPPFSTHLAGWWLRRKTGAPWVAEFRDPWTDNPWKPRHVRTSLSDVLERKLERRCLHSANLVVAVSEGIERVMRPKMIGREDHLILVRNGIDQLSPPESRARPAGPYRIVHVGSFYHGRDPRPFLRGLAALRTTRSLTPDEMEVQLVGQCRWFDGVSIEQEVEALGLADLVRFQDWVPHAAAQQLVNSADLLLLLAQNQPDQVPNKLYEYLGVRRPILAFVDPEGESARMLEQIGGHFVLTDGDTDRAEAALRRALNAETGNHRPDSSGILESWTSARQFSQLVQAVEALS